MQKMKIKYKASGALRWGPSGCAGMWAGVVRPPLGPTEHRSPTAGCFLSRRSLTSSCAALLAGFSSVFVVGAVKAALLWFVLRLSRKSMLFVQGTETH